MSFYLNTCEQQEVSEVLNYTPELMHDAMSLIYEKSNVISDTIVFERKFQLLFVTGEIKFFNPIILPWQSSWTSEHYHLSKLSFLQLVEAPNGIWLQ